MTKRFRLRDGLSLALIPGAGMVRAGNEVVGGRFERFVPDLLVPVEAVEEPVSDRHAEPAAVGLPRAAEAPAAPAPVESSPLPALDAPSEVKPLGRPDASWKKDDLLAYAELLGVTVPSGSTKKEILDLILSVEAPPEEGDDADEERA